jgi:hypothetical protein
MTMNKRLLILMGLTLSAVGCAATTPSKSTRKHSPQRPSQTVTFTGNRQPGQHSPVDDYVTSVSLSRQQALAHYQVAMRRAKKLLAAKKFDAALDAVSIALATLDSRRAVLRSGEYNDLRSRAVDVRGNVHQRKQSNRLRLIGAASRAAKIDATRSALLQRKQREIRVQRLLQTAQAQRLRLDYAGSQATLETLFAIAPHNTAARAMYPMVVEARLARAYDQRASIRASQIARHQLANEAAAIPYAGVVTYPADWTQLSLIRNR